MFFEKQNNLYAMKTLNRLAISENWLKKVMGIFFNKTGLQDPFDEQSLKIHQRKHTGEKPFKCAQCHFAAYTIRCLKSHMIKQNGQEQYKCKFCE